MMVFPLQQERRGDSSGRCDAGSQRLLGASGFEVDSSSGRWLQVPSAGGRSLS